MKTVLASLAAALALSVTAPLLTIDSAHAAKAKAPAAKQCVIKNGAKKQTWSCAPGQACCVTPEGKGVCGIEGLGCL